MKAFRAAIHIIANACIRCALVFVVAIRNLRIRTRIRREIALRTVILSAIAQIFPDDDECVGKTTGHGIGISRSDNVRVLYELNSARGKYAAWQVP